MVSTRKLAKSMLAIAKIKGIKSLKIYIQKEIRCREEQLHSMTVFIA